MMAAQETVRAVRLDSLLEGMAPASAFAGIEVTGVESDSRRVRPGDVFLAMAGIGSHGLAYLQQAVAGGAIAVAWEPVEDALVEARAHAAPVPAIAVEHLRQRSGEIAARFYGDPTREMLAVGITGTDGKTSVSHFIAQALSMDGQPCGLLGTMGYGLVGDLQAPTHTTPDAVRLQAEFARLLDQGVERFTMEVSSHALHQHRTDAVHFDIAVLTQLSRDHLDYHGSLEAYAEAKRRLFYSRGLSAAVLNTGDAFGQQLAVELRDRLALIAYARDSQVRRFGEWIEIAAVRSLPQGLEVDVISSFGEGRIRSALVGDFNADNLAAALGALLATGVDFDAALQRLSQIQTVPGRMELFGSRVTPRVVVDYAHTANALENALRALRAHCRGELVCVFGAGGDRDRGKRPQMGSVAEQLSDRVIVTSDNPRHESASDIAGEIVAGFDQPQRALVIESRSEAIEAAVSQAGVDDLVLVAGKGHEDYQQVGDRKLPFSDRDLVRQVLGRWVP